MQGPSTTVIVTAICGFLFLIVLPFGCIICRQRRNRRRAAENAEGYNGSAQNFNTTDQPNGQMQGYPGCNQQQQKSSRFWRPFQFRQPQPEPYQPQPQKLQQPQQLNNGAMAYNQQPYPNSNPYQLPYQQQPQQYPPFPQQSNLNKEPVKF